MDEDKSFRNWRQNRRDILLLMVSVTIHASLLVALAFVFTRQIPRGSEEGSRRVSVVLATINESNRVEYIDQNTIEKTDSTIDDVSDPLQIDQPPVDPSLMPKTDSAPLSVDQPIFDAGTMTQVPGKRDGDNSNLELTEDQMRELAAERARLKAMQPKGSPTSLSVFGSGQMTGRSFVFVIDRSKSMGSQGLGVLEKAAMQLQGAVDGLEKDHRFQVVAYHHKTVTIDKRVLLNATPTNKKKVGEFVNNLAAFGGTEHESALISALSFRPDVVLLITDGGYPEMNQTQLKSIKRIAGSRTQISCIQFGTGPLQNRDNFMSKLARMNNGSYTYIDVNKWSKK